MKKLILAATITLAATNVHAEQNSIGGLLIGAGGGALMGQAIGQDTESTLIGTAVGSVVGYIIGNEMEKKPAVHNRHYHPHSHTVVHRPRPVRPTVSHRKPVVHREKHITQYNYYYEPTQKQLPSTKRKCREAEILGTVNGKAKKIYGTVCKTGNGWELVSDRNGYNTHYHNHHDNRFVPGSYRYREHDGQHWVHHRF